MSNTLPDPIHPDRSLPEIRQSPVVPFVGKALGIAGSYLGNQHANAPELTAILHDDERIAYFQEMIATLVEGYVPAIPRQIVWAQRVEDYGLKINEHAIARAAKVAAITAEITEAINFALEVINGHNEAKDRLQNIAGSERTPVQQLMLQRLEEYVGEITEENIRLQDFIDSL